MAQEALKGLISPETPIKITTDLIIQIVAEHYGISKNDIIGKKKPKEIAIPRHISVYLCRDMTDSTLQEIGKALGGRDHSTILNSIKFVETNKENNNKDIVDNLEIIKKKLSPH